MINKDSFYGVMTNHYEVNVFYFLCYSAELDSKHNVAGFRLLSLLCVTLTCTFTGNSIQTIAHFCAFSLGYVEMCINPLSPLSRHKFSIPIFIQLFKDSWENLITYQNIFSLVIILLTLITISLDLCMDIVRRKLMLNTIGT